MKNLKLLSLIAMGAGLACELISNISDSVNQEKELKQYIDQKFDEREAKASSESEETTKEDKEVETDEERA